MSLNGINSGMNGIGNANTVRVNSVGTLPPEAMQHMQMMSGTAINHALVSFDFLNHVPSELLIDNDMASQLRLWNAFCLTQLQYVRRFRFYSDLLMQK